MRVLIVGGGIVGTAIAHELAGQGRQVTVLERAVPGAEASTAAAGMLAPQLEATGPGPMLELSLRSRGLYPGWTKQLTTESGVETGYVECGGLQLAMTEAQAHDLDAMVAWQQATGLRATLLGADEARALEPNLSKNVIAAAHLPDDHQVDPRRLMQALSSAAAKRGVTFRAGHVRRVLSHGSAATGVDLDGETLEAELVIVAAGAWSSLVPGALIEPTHLKPMRGQMVELSLRAPPLTRFVKSGLGYVVPRASGRVICGTTAEFAGYDKRVTAKGLATVLSQAIALCPLLEDATVVESWAGLRPWTTDALPLLGRSTLDGLLIASGHFRNGILLAPLTARLIGQLVRGERTTIDLAPFAPSRFG
jgi:glycine oxidase